MIDRSIRYMDGGGVAVPQQGGSTELSGGAFGGALSKLIAQNPEIIEALKKEQQVDSNIEDMPFAIFNNPNVVPNTVLEELRKSYNRPVTIGELEGEPSLGGGLFTPEFKEYAKSLGYEIDSSLAQMDMGERLIWTGEGPPPIPTEANSSYPTISNGGSGGITEIVQNPFQRPQQAVQPQPVNRAQPMNMGQPMNTAPVEAPVSQAPVGAMALTPAEALAQARNPFIRR